MKVSLYNKVAVGALALVGVGAVSSGAWAYTADFSSPELGEQYNGLSSKKLEDVDSSGIDITLKAEPCSPFGCAKLTWGDPKDRDGVGIDSWSYEDDEIEGGKEKLTVTFSQEVELTDIYLADLFEETRNGNTYQEQGQYELNGSGTWVDFTADPTYSNNDGSLHLGLDAMITSIAFTAPGKSLDPSEDHDYALWKLSYSVPTSSVPELDGRAAFGAVGLLFGGLMAGTSRRRKLCAKSGA